MFLFMDDTVVMKLSQAHGYLLMGDSGYKHVYYYSKLLKS